MEEGRGRTFASGEEGYPVATSAVMEVTPWTRFAIPRHPDDDDDDDEDLLGFLSDDDEVPGVTPSTNADAAEVKSGVHPGVTPSNVAEVKVPRPALRRTLTNEESQDAVDAMMQPVFYA